MVMQRNLVEQQRVCDEAGVDLRPHIKTHKSSAIARSQLASGAVGVTCATLSEALALGDAGVRSDVFVSTPVFFDGPKLELLAAVLDRHDYVTLAVDSMALLSRLDSMAPDAVGVMIELDCGLDRTGVDPQVASALAARAGPRLRGVFTHGGQSYAPGAARAAGADEMAALAAVDDLLGLSPLTMSAGSTPTRRISLEPPVTEVRPGTYVFGDHQQVVLGSQAGGEVAAAVVTTIVSVAGDKVVFDAGAKALTKDRAQFLDSYGHVVGFGDMVVDRLNDNHGMARSGRDRPSVGDRLVVVPNHICPVVNLFDELVVVRNDGVSLVPVDLRGHLV